LELPAIPGQFSRRSQGTLRTGTAAEPTHPALGMKRRASGAALTAVLLGALFVASPLADTLRGVSLDLIFALRHLAFGPRHEAAASPSVVVAIDEESYRTPPFADVPQAFWTRELAPVLNAVLDSGASVIAFDVIFPTSVERFVPGYDRDFPRALRAGRWSVTHKPLRRRRFNLACDQ
jgi:adenylate cyclase